MAYLIKHEKNQVSNKLILGKLNCLLLKKGQKVNCRRVLSQLTLQLKTLDRDTLSYTNKSLSNNLVRFIIKVRKKGKFKQEIPFLLGSNLLIYSSTIRLLFRILKKNRQASFHLAFFNELNESFKNQGLLRKQVTDLNRLVILNRKFI
jgi:hypothetical protein